MPTKIDVKTIIPRVSDYGPKPRSARQALIQARDLLAKEGQWATGHYFEDGDAKEAYEASACGSWTACAMGALGLVTGEMPVTVTRKVTTPEDWKLENMWRDAVYNQGCVKSLPAYKKEHKDDELYVEYAWSGTNPDFDSRTPISTSAAQFLAVAFVKGSGDYDNEVLHDVITDPSVAVSNVIDNNDGNNEDATGRSNVLEAFDAAIELAKTGRLPQPPALDDDNYDNY